MNPKIDKLSAEINKTAARITVLQTRLKELQQQKTELENTEILEMVRSVLATPEELAAFIQTYRQKTHVPVPFQSQEEPHYE